MKANTMAILDNEGRIVWSKGYYEIEKKNQCGEKPHDILMWLWETDRHGYKWYLCIDEPMELATWEEDELSRCLENENPTLEGIGSIAGKILAEVKREKRKREKRRTRA